MKKVRYITLILCFAILSALFSSCKNVPHTHSFNQTEIVTPNTCQAGGEIIRKCSCGEGEIFKTSPKSHLLADWEDNGGEYVKVCTLCGETVGSERIYTYLSEGLTFERDLRSDHYSVAGIGKCTDAVVVIPAEFNGIPVTKISNHAFKDCENIEAIIIPDSVNEIGSAAFEDSSVKRIFIPDSVTKIGNETFSQCNALSQLILPNSLKSIGKAILKGARNIEKVILPQGLSILPDSAFAYSSIVSLSLPEGLEKIEDSAFANCWSLKEIYLPDTLTEIGSEAFADCTSLTDLILPDSVTHLGKAAFSGCTSLSSVNIPDGVTSLSSKIFYNCESLKKIYLNANLNSIDGSSFLGINLAETELLIPNENKTFYLIGSSLIGKNPDTVVIGSADGTIPTDEHITRLGNGAFIDRRDLTHIVIPKNITHIGGGAFSGCTNLVSISYEGTVAEWKEVFLGVVWYNGNGVSSVKCSDGEAELVVESFPSMFD